MTLVLRCGCWILAIYLFGSAHSASGVPIAADANSLTLLLLAIFLFLLPFSKSLSLGNVFKFEAQVERLKDEVRDFKTEMRNLVSVQSAALASVSSHVSQQTSITLPPLSSAYAAEERIVEHASPSSAADEDIIADYISAGMNDSNLALAKLRMELESELRRILGKRTNLGEKTDIKFLSLRSLWNEFARRSPDKAYLIDGLQYVNEVANAAIHGQVVPREHAQEALSIGLRVLGELQKISPNGQ